MSVQLIKYPFGPSLIKLLSFSISRMYSLCGAYRKVLVKPKNVSWYFMKYKNDSDDLIQSDLEELRKEEPPKNVEGLLFGLNVTDCVLLIMFLKLDGEFKALILDFCLPTATYATMLLREVFKGDTAASSQIKLETESIATGLSEKRKVEESCIDEEQNSVKKVKVDVDDGVKDDKE